MMKLQYIQVSNLLESDWLLQMQRFSRPLRTKPFPPQTQEQVRTAKKGPDTWSVEGQVLGSASVHKRCVLLTRAENFQTDRDKSCDSCSCNFMKGTESLLVKVMETEEVEADVNALLCSWKPEKRGGFPASDYSTRPPLVNETEVEEWL